MQTIRVRHNIAVLYVLSANGPCVAGAVSFGEKKNIYWTDKITKLRI